MGLVIEAVDDRPLDLPVVRLDRAANAERILPQMADVSHPPPVFVLWLSPDRSVRERSVIRVPPPFVTDATEGDPSREFDDASVAGAARLEIPQAECLERGIDHSSYKPSFK
jgi:hypothetical protein